MQLSLKNLEETGRLASVFAKAIQEKSPQNLLFLGDVGAGKTTLTRFLVESLPGGFEAEISSPSFTICNIYCTSPVVHHFDLYRLDTVLGEYRIDESLEESFDTPTVLTIVEWAERLRPEDFPSDGIVCSLQKTNADDDARLVKFQSLGSQGRSCLMSLVQMYP